MYKSGTKISSYECFNYLYYVFALIVSFLSLALVLDNSIKYISPLCTLCRDRRSIQSVPVQDGWSPFTR